jgi:hypothetical protein
MIYLKLLRKQEQAKPKSSRRRKIIKNKGWNQWNRDHKKTIQRINKTKSWFFVNKIDKPLENVTKMRREKTQINKCQKQKRGDNNKHQGNPGNSGITLKTYIQEIQNGGKDRKSDLLSSVTPETSLRCWSHTWVILIAPRQNNNHHIRCR